MSKAINQFQLGLRSVKRDFPHDDADYQKYLIAFRFLCALRAEFNPKAFDENEPHNQNDLLDSGLVSEVMALIDKV